MAEAARSSGYGDPDCTCTSYVRGVARWWALDPSCPLHGVAEPKSARAHAGAMPTGWLPAGLVSLAGSAVATSVVVAALIAGFSERVVWGAVVLGWVLALTLAWGWRR